MADPFIFADEIYALEYLKLPDAAIIFDIGCSYGEYTLEVIKKMGNRPFTVHCFDPVQDFCKIQKQRFKNFTNIIINNLALYDKKGESMFYRINAPGNQGAEGCSSLTLRPEFITNNWPYVPTLVSTDRLDNYIRDSGVKHIDLMKIDVEGAEMHVFRGGEQMFKKAMVDIIQFEYNTSLKDAEGSMREICDFVYQFNYLLADFKDGKYIALNTFVEDYGFHNYYLINQTYFETL